MTSSGTGLLVALCLVLCGKKLDKWIGNFLPTWWMSSSKISNQRIDVDLRGNLLSSYPAPVITGQYLTRNVINSLALT